MSTSLHVGGLCSDWLTSKSFSGVAFIVFHLPLPNCLHSPCYMCFINDIRPACTIGCSRVNSAHELVKSGPS